MFKKLCILIFLIITAALYCNENKEDKDESKVKFRGTIMIPALVYLSHDPTVNINHFSPSNDTYRYNYTDKGDPHYKHHSRGDEGREIVGSEVGIDTMLSFRYSMIIAAFQGEHPVSRDNNITFTTIFDINPLSMEGGLEISVTPIPFIVLSAGTTFGTGWNFPDSGAYGLARNNYSGNDPGLKKKIYGEDHLFGPVMHNWFSFTFQFDWGDMIENPKASRWMHFFLTGTATIESTYLLTYPHYLQPFMWTGSETMNGWNFTTEFALGYGIPIVLDERKDEAEKKMFLGPVRHRAFTLTVAVMVDTSMSLTYFNSSKMADQGFGSDFVDVAFGPALLFDLPCNLEALVGFYFANGKTFSDETIGNIDYLNREYQDWYIAPSLLVLGFGWNF